MLDRTEWLTGVIIIATASVIYFHLKKFTYWSKRNIKGPMPWPILGTNIYYLFENKLDIEKRWAEQYGKVYGLYEGYSPLLRVNDSELVHFIYVKQFRSFTDRHDEFVYGDNQKNWMLWIPGTIWSARRSLVSPLFSSSRMKLMVRAMADCINRFLKEVDDRLSSAPALSEKAVLDNSPNGNSNGNGVQMKKTDISSLTLDVIATNFYSLKLDTYRNNDEEFLKQAYSLAKFELGRFFVWSLLPRQIAKAIKFDLFPFIKWQYFDLLAKKIIDERRKHGKGRMQAKLDIVQALLDAKLEDTSKLANEKEESKYSGQASADQLAEIRKINTRPVTGLSDTEIRGQMSFLFVAGFETTATAINFCLYELAHQPELQDRLYDELVQVFGSNLSTIASKHEPFPSDSYAILMDLVLLDAFISETMRLYVPIIENNRKVTEPIELPTEPPLALPVGIPISTNSFILQRDPDYWHEPDKFDINRFLPENRDRIKPGSYMPFGMGARHCLGMRFALLEMKMALAKIILNHRIEPVSADDYPAKFQQNVVFLLLEKNDFILVPRAS
jgi:cytochrome P450